jgi:hypothetical protein
MQLLRSFAALSIVVSTFSAGCASSPTPSPDTSTPPLETGSAPSIETSYADPTSETFDGIRVGMRADAVQLLLGPPDEKGTPVEMGATGMFEADWRWKSRGLTTRMGAASADAEPSVSGMEIAGASTLRTSRDIALGATRAEVEAMYEDALGKGRQPDEPNPDNERLLVLGSVYGGTFFRFENGKLVSIYVGAGAE